MPLDEDIEKLELEKGLRERKYHEELTDMLSQVRDSISSQSNKDVINVIEKQNQLIEKFIQEVQKSNSKELPSVNVDVNQKEVVISVGEMTNRILEGFQEAVRTLQESLVKKEEPVVKRKFIHNIVRDNRDVAQYIESEET